MPIIKVFDPGGRKRLHLAAAATALALSEGSEPVKATKRAKRSRVEKTRPRNPNSLTFDQHVFPLKTMEQFAQDGRVSVYLISRGKVLSAKPSNPLFCACRAWDERAEAGYMKRIEDEFQAVVAPIVDGKVGAIASEQKPAVDRMYALWYMRARYKDLEEQEIQLHGIAGYALTKEREENLEKNGYMFARKGGTMPARQLNSVQLQMRIARCARQLAASVTRWGVISSQSGEFIVPDVPLHLIIPLSPCLSLVGSSPDDVIVEQSLAEINRATRAASQEYFFARDLAACPV